MAGNSESLRTAPVLHVIPVGTSLLGKKDFKATVSGRPADLPRIKETLAQLETRHHRFCGTDLDPIKAFENPTLDSAIEALKSKFNVTLELGDLKRAYEVLHHLNPKDELEKRLHPGSKRKDLLPAELSSLYLFYGQMEQKDRGKEEFKLPIPSVKDDVLLLVTDTMEGAFCACCLRNYLLENNEPVPLISPFIRDVRLTIMGGLQVEDAKRFVVDGAKTLKNEINKADQWAHQQNCSTAYLNVTGGYKGVIPLMAVFGLDKGWRLYYAYEESPAIIDVRIDDKVLIVQGSESSDDFWESQFSLEMR